MVVFLKTQRILRVVRTTGRNRARPTTALPYSADRGAEIMSFVMLGIADIFNSSRVGWKIFVFRKKEVEVV